MRQDCKIRWRVKLKDPVEVHKDGGSKVEEFKDSFGGVWHIIETMVVLILALFALPKWANNVVALHTLCEL